LAQLSVGGSEPVHSTEPVSDEPTEQAHPESELDRVAAKVSAAMNGKKDAEPDERPARQRNELGQFAAKTASEKPADSEVERIAETVTDEVSRRQDAPVKNPLTKEQRDFWTASKARNRDAPNP
jgi:uncharacterized protein (DUF2267 family)